MWILIRIFDGFSTNPNINGSVFQFCLCVVNVWAWKQRHQPHLWRFIPGTKSEETSTVQFTVGIWKTVWRCSVCPQLMWCFHYRQEKEAWINAKYVEKKFLKKLGATEILINGERKPERRWSVKKCRRHNSATTVPKTRRRYRQELGSTSPSTLSAGTNLTSVWI